MPAMTRSQRVKIAVEELNTRIQALPQELQDNILWSTEGFKIPDTVFITKPISGPDGDGLNAASMFEFETCFKSPLALQLNRKLRAQFAKKFFGTARFEYVGMDHFQIYEAYEAGEQRFRDHPLSRWIQSMEKAHRGMIQSMQMTELNRGEDFFELAFRLAKKARDGVQNFLVKAEMGDVDRLDLVLASVVDTAGGWKMERYSGFSMQLMEKLPVRFSGGAWSLC